MVFYSHALHRTRWTKRGLCDCHNIFIYQGLVLISLYFVKQQIKIYRVSLVQWKMWINDMYPSLWKFLCVLSLTHASSIIRISQRISIRCISVPILNETKDEKLILGEILDKLKNCHSNKSIENNDSECKLRFRHAVWIYNILLTCCIDIR